MSTILFYDDVSIFGGHQITAVNAVKSLLLQDVFDISFVLSKSNLRLIESLTLIKGNYEGKLNIVIIDEPPSIKNIILNPFSAISPLKTIIKLINQINPDLLIGVQGNIFLSFLGILAGNICGVKTISLIPMGIHRTKVTMKSKLQDKFIAGSLYSLPNVFITASKSARAKMIDNGVKKKQIDVVYCGVDIDRLLYHDRALARNVYEMRETEYAIAVVGRIEFCHKAQDFFVKSILDSSSLPNNIRLYIVGDGSDRETLVEIIKSQDEKKIVKILPWDNDLTRIYSAIDMLLIPSWYEGLPLVMLEAMHYGIPIVASDIDGMAEILPKQWLFECGNSKDLIRTIENVMRIDNSEIIEKNKAAIIESYNLRVFGDRFCELIMGHVKKHS